MSNDSGSGLVASVKQRLLNLSRRRKENFNLLLNRYGIERLLYRLTQSTHRDAFVLKGAMLFAVWAETPHRPTADLDLLGFGSASGERLAQVFRELCSVKVEPDGLAFDADSVTVQPIREESAYQGLRVRLLTRLGSAKIPLQIDVGFGDAITPAPPELQFGPLLEMPAPVLRTYPPETVVAEKLEALVVLGMSNTRMKDYFDLWTLGQTMPFEFNVLRAAVMATFERRQTALPDPVPIGLAEAFGDDDTKQRQWVGFLRKMSASANASNAPTLPEVIGKAREFLLPVLGLSTSNSTTPHSWPPGGPWA